MHITNDNSTEVNGGKMDNGNVVVDIKEENGAKMDNAVEKIEEEQCEEVNEGAVANVVTSSADSIVKRPVTVAVSESSVMAMTPTSPRSITTASMTASGKRTFRLLS